MPFRSVFQFSASVAVGLFLVACSASDIPQPANSVTRAQAMQIARAYVELQWQGDPRLIMHGQDPDGMRVGYTGYCSIHNSRRYNVVNQRHQHRNALQMGMIRHARAVSESYCY